MEEKNSNILQSNILYYGDNLQLMKELPSDSIDLIYLDPPFNSKRNYNVMYKSMTGLEVPEQVEAFCDTWTMDAEKQSLLDNMLDTMNHYKMDADFVKLWDFWIRALRQTRKDLTAYLLYMTIRLLEMKRLLKDTGSIYLHCDPTASHYIKVLMDGVFGYKNFINEIVWHYRTYIGQVKSYYPKKHDIIFWYAKDINKRDKSAFKLEYANNYQDTVDFERWKKYYVKNKEGEYTNIITFGNHPKEDTRFQSYLDRWRKEKDREPQEGEVIYRCNGFIIDDTWIDIQAIDPKDKKQKLGFSTQKPVPLLKRIIQASCPEGGTVLDPFCGCGTTIYATHELNTKHEDGKEKSIKSARKWIGMDIAILSTRLVRDQLTDKYHLHENRDFTIDGIPVSVEQAKDLWKRDPFQFQNWAVEYVNGFCTNKKTRDGGVDGRLYFRKKKELKNMVISVKGGKLKLAEVRDLMGVVKGEAKDGAVFGGIISFDAPTKDMKDYQVQQGLYNKRKEYPILQFLSVKQMLEEKKLFKVPDTLSRKDTKKHSQSSF